MLYVAVISVLKAGNYVKNSPVYSDAVLQSSPVVSALSIQMVIQ